MSLPRPTVYAIDGVVPVIHPTAFVHPAAVLIGDVVVGPGCYVGPGASLRGDFGRIILEEGCNVQDNCTLHAFPGEDAVVEVDGHVGHGAVLHGGVVKRGALVGMNAVIMDGAVIGENSIVAAMAFVKAGFQVPPRSLVAGLPAKVVRALRDDEIAWKAEGTQEYQRLAIRSLATMTACAPLEAVEPDRPRVDAGSSQPLYQVKGA
ncbi:transferase hexapeptide repeat family protein [Azospirillum agricola]|uniref:transferase hexapeptide repeat family protein n=1 Tax=Azospirillum agricola TaxID=1720247 RepID=UPI000A0F3050|nr:transferase hexapeptide repeat family protein [Azospirillum agricola]SMH54638.1 phenylacetic acid degradation protein [Azospirillum lipoferum]